MSNREKSIGTSWLSSRLKEIDSLAIPVKSNEGEKEGSLSGLEGLLWQLLVLAASSLTNSRLSSRASSPIVRKDKSMPDKS